MKHYTRGYLRAVSGEHDALIEVIDEDTFTAASEEDNPCCLNFASHKRPGGGYKSVMDLRMPIKTQEEDLFRRSDLPKIMDNEVALEYYPLKKLAALYCTCTVSKDKYLNPVEPFEVGIVTVPAVINPTQHHESLIKDKVYSILGISAGNKHETIILGAWGCGVFNNDPEFIAKCFKECLNEDFKGVFKKVIFAIPGVGSHNHRKFKEVL